MTGCTRGRPVVLSAPIAPIAGVFLLAVTCCHALKSASTPPAPLSFAKVYSDSMVLQREPQQASLWGYSSPNAAVSLSIDGLPAAKTTANASGVWFALLPAQPTSGSADNHTIVASSPGTPDAAITDVLFGDVWVCSGQSNMAFAMGTPLVDPVSMAKLGLNQTADIAAAANYPGIRVMTVGDIRSTYPMPDFGSDAIHQPWTRASPASIGSAPDVMGNGKFSATCWYYGRNVFDALKQRGKETPIGLLHASWGGSSVEDWMDYETLRPPTGGSCPGPIGNGCCGAAAMQQYNGMIRPIENVTIFGSIWYQGESNAGEESLYTCRFNAMMAQWRRQWHEGTRGATSATFPFGVVQIGPDVSTDAKTYATRQGQTAGFGYMPNPQQPHTFLAAAFDLPNPDGTK